MKEKYFNWSRFPLRFLKAVLSSEATPSYARPDKYYDDADFLCPYMDDVSEWPNSHFVRRYRREIEDYFLPEGNHLVDIAHRLEQKNYGGITVKVPEDILMDLRRQKLSNTIIDAYRTELLKVGMDADDGWEPATDFTKPFTFDLLASAALKISLYPYQEEAVSAMKRHFLDEDKSAGILVMPTGSGKTMTSVYFLLKEMASRGYEIIWLAHRFMLVEQAAGVFYRLSPLVKEGSRPNTARPSSLPSTAITAGFLMMPCGVAA